MTTETLTLTDFLLARIAEDEASAQRVMPYVEARGAQIVINLTRTETLPDGTRRSVSEMASPYDPARVLAECAAKRAIVELHRIWLQEHEGVYLDGQPGPHGVEARCVICGTNGTYTTSASAGCETLGILALPYADHPDYRDEWRA
jgi:hypothetical protein